MAVPTFSFPWLCRITSPFSWVSQSGTEFNDIHNSTLRLCMKCCLQVKLSAFKFKAYADVTMTHAVAQSVEALRYKPEGRGFDSPMVSLEFFFDIILPAALWPWRRLSL